MILVIGSINLDLTCRVERLPVPGETVSNGTFAQAPGGKGANQALAARRAGSTAAMIGAVGRDSNAGPATALLRAAGIDLSGVVDTDATTGTALILVSETSGENMIAVASGANLCVSPDRVAELDMTGDDIVLLQHEVPLETVSAALDKAARTGARTIVNTAPWKASCETLFVEAAFAVFNETEFDQASAALGLSGAREERMATLARSNNQTIVVTLGADGVLAATPNAMISVPAIRITPVDTVGAGDTFCGYLAASLDQGMTLETALRRASIAGSLACLAPGAQPAIPLASAVDARLAEANL
jgi:ribokinase